MASIFQLTPRAVEDLEEIWKYIAADSVDAANRVEKALFEAFQKLAEHPHMGCIRKEITPLPVRFWTVPRYPNYIIVYRSEGTPLQMLTILHGRRDLQACLEGIEEKG